jgi:Ca-activated chloride channel homolog
VTFASPWVLVALAALPLLAGLYAWSLRRSAGGGEAFAASHLIASVQPRLPGWRRHAPLVVLLLALGVLIVAAARPQQSVGVPVEQASIVLATDVSGSMLATIEGAPDRLTAAKRAALVFLDEVPEKVNVGIMAFNQRPAVLQSPTTDREAARAAVTSQVTSGGTATGDAIEAALQTVEAMPATDGGRPPAAIVLLSDGKSKRGTDPIDAATKAGERKVPVYTVTLGTPQDTLATKTRRGGTRVQRVPPDPATLRAVAEASGGESFAVADASRLDQVYERLGSQLSRTSEKRQVTTWFAGGGLLMLLAAAGMSLRWFGRLV